MVFVKTFKYIVEGCKYELTVHTVYTYMWVNILVMPFFKVSCFHFILLGHDPVQETILL